MAVIDEYEDRLPVQNTGKHIRALDANGNPILIPIEEVAKVVGGLVGFNSSVLKQKEHILSGSFNDERENGYYYINSTKTISDGPINWVTLGVLFQINTMPFRTQWFFNHEDHYWVRTCWNNNWGIWHSIF